MDANNKQILAAILRNKPLLIVLLVVFILIPLILLMFSLRGQPSRFVLQSITPENGSSVGPNDTNVVLEFNQDLLLLQKDPFQITIEPEIEFVYGVLDNKLQINISNLRLVDNQTYNIRINNLLSRSNEVIRSINTSFTVDLPDSASQFLSELPYKGEGFTVTVISDRTLYANVTNTPEERYEEAVLELLREVGLSTTKFNVDINLPSQTKTFDDDLIRHFD
ncbi:MAG TPA: hypothetical protein VF996_03290 [Candidatus Saccharimonadales bacterium]|jgi:hypothetical protein